MKPGTDCNKMSKKVPRRPPPPVGLTDRAGSTGFSGIGSDAVESRAQSTVPDHWPGTLGAGISPGPRPPGGFHAARAAMNSPTAASAIPASCTGVSLLRNTAHKPS